MNASAALPAEPDASALERARSGERQAFDALVAPLMPRLHAFALRMVADHADAGDVVQEALLKG